MKRKGAQNENNKTITGKLLLQNIECLRQNPKHMPNNKSTRLLAKQRKLPPSFRYSCCHTRSRNNSSSFLFLPERIEKIELQYKCHFSFYIFRRIQVVTIKCRTTCGRIYQQPKLITVIFSWLFSRAISTSRNKRKWSGNKH